MAIEVVKEGNYNPDEQFHTTCKRCGTVFNFLRKDGMANDKKSVYCPKCKQVIFEETWKEGKAPTE
ncbi:hypothetical protein J5751_05850 [bacterium]|nr:hypothetical protein [bacterium]